MGNPLARKTTVLLISLLVILSGCTRMSQVQLHSPDQRLEIDFRVESGVPSYQITYKNRRIVEAGLLGLSFRNAPPLDSAFRVVGVSHSTNETAWNPVWGTTEQISDHYREMEIELEETTSDARKLTLVFRAYNDGVAFRYLLPEQGGIGGFTITKEHTAFRFGENYPCFALKRQGFLDNYEGHFQRTSLGQLQSGDLIGPPLLMQAPNCWLAVTEANLTDYAGMSLRPDSREPNRLMVTLAPDTTDPEIEVRGRTPHQSPWRTILVAEHPGKLIESNLLWNLNDPHQFESTDWIQPGTVIWPWWNGRIARDQEFSGEPGTELMRYYTDFAAETGIPYLLVDAGWYSLESDAWDQPEKEDILTMEETREEFYDIREVIDYATDQGVKVLLWVHIESLRDRLDEALSTYADWGISGIKVDSDGGEYQRIVSDLHRILRVAADYELMVDYHGAYKPTGIERTYPNFMTREGVLGLEHAKWSDNVTPTHDVTLPYTRMLLGHMDYTPGAFDLDGTEGHPKQVKGTRAHQIAMYVVYFSPLQMLVDYPDAYRSAPEQFAFLQNVPTSWSETRFLEGEPGEYIIMARRKGADWFVGAMTDEDPRDIQIPLDFLPENWTYTAHIYRDGLDADVRPEHVVVEEREVDATVTLSASLANGGGMAVRLTPDQED